MKLSYIGTRATKDSTDKKRYAEAKWKDGDMNADLSAVKYGEKGQSYEELVSCRLQGRKW